MLGIHTHYNHMYNQFNWNIPEYFNIGVDICDKWAKDHPDRIAIIDVNEKGISVEYSFSRLQEYSNKLANALLERGITFSEQDYSDRVGIFLPQRFETAVAHVAVSKMGCIAIPLFTLFGEDAILHRLHDSGAKAVITDKVGCEKLKSLREQLPDLTCVISLDGETDAVEDFNTVVESQSIHFNARKTKADDPALLIYTSGTTGSPKGVLHAHRVLLGHLPGVEMSHDFLPHAGDRFWTPADWAWIGGLLDVLMPSLHHGITVVACRFSKFTAQAAFDLMKNNDVKNVFLPPTALKLMLRLPDAETYGIQLRSVGSGGEPLAAELNEWCKRALGATINEFYGQTECNMVVSSCSAIEPPTSGVMGRSVPGHRVEIIDEKSGEIAGIETEGEIAVLAPDPVMFIQYWNQPEATENKFIDGPDGKWLLTGDRGVREQNGKLRFLGREDDVIGSSGYRIGPGEIESCLIRHEAVELAGVVGKPDELRGSVVAAYIKLAGSTVPSKDLELEIAEFVKTHLAAHEYPRVVRFVDAMPMTTTGKIIRGELRKLAEAEFEAEKLSVPD